jgi:hypothetical protein
LDGAALHRCISCLFQNSTFLERLEFDAFGLQQAAREFHPSPLGTSQTLKELHLVGSCFGSTALRVLTDSLIGNTSLMVLKFKTYCPSEDPIGLDAFFDVTQLFESTQIQELQCGPISRNSVNHIPDGGMMMGRLENAIANNTFMKSLDLGHSNIPLQAAQIIFHALVRNTTLEQLTFGKVDSSFSNSSSDDSRSMMQSIIKSLTDMKGLRRLHMELDDSNDVLLEAIMPRFRESARSKDAWNVFFQNSTLIMPILYKNSSLEELGGLDVHLKYYPEDAHLIQEIKSRLLERNRCIRRARSLLTLQPPPRINSPTSTSTSLPTIIRSKSGIWPNAMARLLVPTATTTTTINTAVNYVGASAVFLILQTRPDLMEKQLPRPSATTATTTTTTSQHLTAVASRQVSRRRAREPEAEENDGWHDTRSVRSKKESSS